MHNMSRFSSEISTGNDNETTKTTHQLHLETTVKSHAVRGHGPQSHLDLLTDWKHHPDPVAPLWLCRLWSFLCSFDYSQSEMMVLTWTIHP